MTMLQIALAAVCALVILWFSVKLVKAILRLLSYLLVFGLAVLLVWYLLH